jgi:8-oxo-dGTP pyrophosphatase MutT (NUDIX family)
MDALPVVTVDELDLLFVPQPWPFAEERQAEIAAHFAARRRTTPQLWNGRVLLLSAHAWQGRRLSGTFFETDFASFLAWRDWGCPDPSVINCFAMGALRSADGAYLVGVMGKHTSSAGRIYFPAGTPDPSDVRGSTVDLDSNVLREVAEETGLEAADFDSQPGWRAVAKGPRIALFKLLQAKMSAMALQARILDFIARQAEPEFVDIRIVRGPNDLDPAIPEVVASFLMQAW